MLVVSYSMRKITPAASKLLHHRDAKEIAPEPIGIRVTPIPGLIEGPEIRFPNIYCLIRSGEYIDAIRLAGMSLREIIGMVIE